jgi:Spy/CpxP family protein refolding chaperone
MTSPLYPCTALLAALLLAAGAPATAAGAAAQAAAATSAPDLPPHPGPYLPPDKRKPSSEPPAAGEELRAQAMQKLKKRFEEADLDASGSLTREEARKAGLGFVVKNFDRIDSAHRGLVSFDDLKAFLHQRRKEAMARQQAGE